MRMPPKAPRAGAVADNRQVVPDDPGSPALGVGKAVEEVGPGPTGTGLSDHRVAASWEGQDSNRNGGGERAIPVLPEDGASPGNFIPEGNRPRPAIEGDL